MEGREKYMANGINGKGVISGGGEKPPRGVNLNTVYVATRRYRLTLDEPQSGAKPTLRQVWRGVLFWGSAARLCVTGNESNCRNPTTGLFAKKGYV